MCRHWFTVHWRSADFGATWWKRWTERVRLYRKVCRCIFFKWYCFYLLQMKYFYLIFLILLNNFFFRSKCSVLNSYKHMNFVLFPTLEECFKLLLKKDFLLQIIKEDLLKMTFLNCLKWARKENLFVTFTKQETKKLKRMKYSDVLSVSEYYSGLFPMELGVFLGGYIFLNKVCVILRTFLKFVYLKWVFRGGTLP